MAPTTLRNTVDTLTKAILDELLNRAHTAHGAARVTHAMPEHDGQGAISCNLMAAHSSMLLAQTQVLLGQPGADSATASGCSQNQCE